MTTPTTKPAKTALITGSTDTRGIGFAAALLLASRHEFDVILSGRRSESVEVACTELRDRLGPSDAKIFGLIMDVTDSDSIKQAVASLSNAEGPLGSDGCALDVLINNAGVGAPPGRGGKQTSNMFLQTELTTAEDMGHVFATNVGAIVEVTSKLAPHWMKSELETNAIALLGILADQFLPLLAKSAAPRVVNISSARGSLSFGSSLEPARTGALVYNASKAALSTHPTQRSSLVLQLKSHLPPQIWSRSCRLRTSQRASHPTSRSMLHPPAT